MRLEKPPAVCPRCGSSRTVRLIWRCVHLFGEDENDVKAGTAIIVNPQVAQSYEPWQGSCGVRPGSYRCGVVWTVPQVGATCI